MELLEVIKSLSNETRLNILKWLKDPFAHFPEEELSEETSELGVCVSDIAKKAGMSIPTVSDYLKTMSIANVLIATRRGQWTYYKRNEEAFAALSKLIGSEI